MAPSRGNNLASMTVMGHCGRLWKIVIFFKFRHLIG
jgi:hypothetical protein